LRSVEGLEIANKAYRATSRSRAVSMKRTPPAILVTRILRMRSPLLLAQRRLKRHVERGKKQRRDGARVGWGTIGRTIIALASSCLMCIFSSVAS
jgi:hypothetical protein